MKPDIAVVIESPENLGRSFDALKHIVEPLEDDGFSVTVINCLDGEPRNGKSATKTEIKQNQDRVLKAVSKFDFSILVGNTSLQMVTGKAGISKRRGKPIEEDGRLYLPMNNPSIIKHDPLQEDILLQDLKLFNDCVEFGGVPEEEELNIRLVLTWDDFNDLLDDLTGTVSFDIETNSLYPWQTHVTKRVDGKDVRVPEPAHIVSLGFGTRNTQWIIPVNHPRSPWDFHEVQEMVDEISEVIDDLYVIMHNGKFDLLWMWVHFGVQWPIDFDTMLAHFLLNENMRHGLKYLAMMYCGAPDWEVDLDTKQGKSTLKALAKYHAHDLYYTRELRFVLGKMLTADQEVKRVFDKIMMPCARLFVEVEMDGVYIDTTKFDDAEKYLRDQYNAALADLKRWEPKHVVNGKGKEVPFNWGSSQQLAKLLFEDLKIPVVERTKTGAASCSESVINRIDHPCTSSLLKFREAKQQLSFFIDGWKPFLHERNDGFYLHPSFKLHGTVTGRLSCEHPNLQQVPRDKRIRTLITAPPGWTLIECDLSQIELRIAAELANEQNMLYAFANSIDVHWLTAISEISRSGALKDLVLSTARAWKQDKTLNYSQSIEVLLEMGPDAAAEINEGWKENRKKAKAVNFGYLYGMWWKKFKMYARDNYGVEVTDDQAQQSREAFFDNYPDFIDWHDRQRRYARKNGFVKTLSGRKRRLPEAMSAQDTPERREAERQAINSPVQSFANELNLMAAIQLRKEFGRNVVKICGTVHDAILLRARNDYVERVYNRLLEIMSHPELMDEFGIDIFVPIEAEGKVGPWGAGTSIKKWLEANDNDEGMEGRRTRRVSR